MPEFLSPGVFTTELRVGVPDIQGVPTATGAFTGPAAQGPINVATLITSFTNFQRVFGSFTAGSFLAESVQAFFANGGNRCYVVRVAHYTDISNTATLTAIASALTLATSASGATSGTITSSGTQPFNMEPADTLIIDVDTNGDLTATFDAGRATKAGAGATFAAMASESFTVEMNNDGNIQVITFGTEATQQLAVDLINANLLGGFAVINGVNVDIVADQRGTGSEVDVTASDAGVVAKLGITVATVTGSGDVANIDAVTGAEVKTVVEADIVGLTVTVNGDNTITITSNTTGATSSIQVNATSTLDTVMGFDNVLHSGAASGTAQNTIIVTAASEGVHGDNLGITTTKRDTNLGTTGANLTAGAQTQATLATGVTKRLRVGAQVLINDPVTTVSIRVVVTEINADIIVFASTTVAAGGILVANVPTVTLEEFDLTVLRGGTAISDHIFQQLSMSALDVSNFYVDQLNSTDPARQISVADQGVVLSNAVDPRPTAVINTLLTGGNDGTAIVDADFTGDSGAQTGYFAFDKIDQIALIAAPGQTTSAAQNGLLDYCEGREDVFAILDSPLGNTVQQVQTYATVTANFFSSFGSFYFPQIQVLDPITGILETFPPSGYIVGAFARTDTRRNVARVAAGQSEGQLRGALGVELKLDRGDQDTLYPSNINPIISPPGRGTYINGSRTLETGEFRQANVRRTFLFVAESLQEGTGFVLFENNTPETRARLVRTITSFLLRLWRAKILTGARASEAFFVICTEGNNPPSIINAGQLICRVGIAVGRPSEFLNIELQQDTRALDAELAAAA